MFGQTLNNTEASDRWPSELPDFPGDPDGNTGIPCNDFGKPVSQNTWSGFVRPMTMAGQVVNNTEVSNGWSSEIPDLTCDPDNKSGIPLNGFGKPIYGDVHSLHE